MIGDLSVLREVNPLPEFLFILFITPKQRFVAFSLISTTVTYKVNLKHILDTIILKKE